MTLRALLGLIPTYLMEVFVRSKAAWGGGAVIIVVAILEHATGTSLPGSWYAVALLLAVIGAQLWHGLVQFERMRARFTISQPKQHFWDLDAKRGSSGTGYYFEVHNLSTSDSLESVEAQLLSVQPEMVRITPFPLHIRHKDYRTVSTSINPGSYEAFDIATGPDHNSVSQPFIVLPGIIGGDRGYSNGVSIPYGRYLLKVRISATNCPPCDVAFNLWVEHDFLMCEARSAL